MSLSAIQSLRAAAVLEDCAQQLDILGHSLSVQMRRERGPAPGQGPSLGATPQLSANSLLLSSVCLGSYNTEKVRLLKLKTDCLFITQHISELCSELEEKGRFSSFPEAVEEEKRQREDGAKREEEITLKQRRQAVDKQELDILAKRDELNNINVRLNELKQQLSQAKNKKPNNVTMSQQMLTETWQRAHLKDKLEFLQKQLVEETTSHEESEKFLQNQQTELRVMLRNWKQQTKEMQQDKQKKLDNLGCKRTLNTDRLMEMRRKFRVMEQVIMEDKEEQEKLRELEEKARIATKLQAWWRGCMVRRGLGAFKKAGEGKKGKKKKGKKKKK
uniref:Dynein regulatory complex protein 9 n=1 Tax=Fundulus heteroclitus TaxID=8078 RepID=A0A146ZX08_FUNHE